MPSVGRCWGITVVSRHDARWVDLHFSAIIYHPPYPCLIHPFSPSKKSFHQPFYLTHRLPSHDPSASGGRHLCPSRAGAADPSGGEVVGSSPASQHPLLARAVLGWTQLQGRAAHGCRELNMSGFVTVCLKVLPLIPPKSPQFDV